MARKNRLVVEDGFYHVTARVAHKAHLLADPAFKARIVEWIYGVADFSGVDVCAWNVMDSHIHVYLHVPPVPEKYWSVPRSAGACPRGTPADGGAEGACPAPRRRVPVASAFSMRPAENRAPRWSPDLLDRDHPITPAGDRPSAEAVAVALANGLPVATVPHPPTNFTLPDAEMLERLGHLHGPKAVAAVAERWSAARAAGRGDSVEREKDAYCRRMYNVSQYMNYVGSEIMLASRVATLDSA